MHGDAQSGWQLLTLPLGRVFKRTLAGLSLAGVLLVGKGYWNATRDPVVRTANVKVADWPEDSRPVKALLISDIHVAGPDMPPRRVLEIARQMNALKPDIVLIAGDLHSGKRVATAHYSTSEIIDALKHFRAPLGTVIVLGNHDEWHDAAGFRKAIRKSGMTLVDNDAIQRGSLVIGGIGDHFTRRADPAKTAEAMARLTGAKVVLTHSPDVIPDLVEPVAAVFAGHTHCGQAYWPWSETPIVNSSAHGMRFQCGDITDKGQRIFVSAGLGTSVLWLRYGAPPDVWLVTLGP